MAITAGTLLAVYFVAVLYVLVAPAKQRDPAMSAAQGCLFALVLALAGAGALLAIGIVWQVRWLVIAMFIITIAPFAWAILGAPIYVVMRIKRRRENQRWTVASSETSTPTPPPPS